MQNIFLGFVFILLNFNLNLGSIRIGLIPTFVGYILLATGIDELSPQYPPFGMARRFCFAMIVYHGILYTLDLIGLADNPSFNFPLDPLLGAIATVIMLYISYQTVQALLALEKETATLLKTDALFSAWVILAVFHGAAFILQWMPLLWLFLIFGGICINIYFLYTLNATKNLFLDSALNNPDD